MKKSLIATHFLEKLRSYQASSSHEQKPEKSPPVSIPILAFEGASAQATAAPKVPLEPFNRKKHVETPIIRTDGSMDVMPTTPVGFEVDERGLVRACPQCGRRNRLLYERLGQKFRCSQCHTELQQPAEPIDVHASAQFETLISKSALPALVDFWAPWCAPCKMIAPEVAKVSARGAGRWIVIKVNTEDLPEVSARFGIRAIPTLAAFRGGRELARHSGVMPAQSIEQFLQQAL